MEIDEMRSVLSGVLKRETQILDGPTEKDWMVLKEKFQCDFDTDFQYFISLMSEFAFPGDIFNVSNGRTNGNDSITLVFDFEVAHNPDWDCKKIPFFGIGNGDYYCLDSSECPKSLVYYYYHDQDCFKEHSSTFEEWVRAIPEFLLA